MSDRGGGDERLEEALRQRLEAMAAEVKPSDSLSQLISRHPPRRLAHPLPWHRRLASRPAWGGSRPAGRVEHRVWRLVRTAAVGALLVGSASAITYALAQRPQAPPQRPQAPPRIVRYPVRTIIVHGAQATSVEAPAPVAWVAGGQAWASAGSGPLRPLSPPGLSVANPEWSHDGQWLAYLIGAPSSSTQELVVTEPTAGVHHVLATGQGLAFTWSPVSDEIAFTDDDGGLEVAPVSGPAADLVALGVNVRSFDWSPLGDAVAVTEDSSAAAAGEQVLTLPVPGAPGHSQVVWSGPPGQGVFLAGWWPDAKGLLVWISASASAAAEQEAEETGLPLYAIPFGSSPRLLGTTFLYLPWVTWAPGGQLLAIVEGAGLPWAEKSIAICRFPQMTCSALPQPAGTVDLDPAWSPDGTRLAFVRASASSKLPVNSTVNQWYPTRRLWTVLADGRGAGPVAGAAAGAAAPTWVAGGTEIGYSTASGVQVVSSSGGRLDVLARGLQGGMSSGAGPAGYGKLPWGGVAIWAGG